MKLIITGASGFVGEHLKSYLNNADITFAECNADVRDFNELEDEITENEVDAVIHLAAQSFVPKSFENPKETFDINFYGTLNVLEVLNKACFTGTFLYISSGDIYGSVGDLNLPISEVTSPKPRNPYAVSKVAAEALCFQWSQTGSFQCIMARPFNHIGPMQADSFVISDFAKQITEIKLGIRNSVLNVGDIDVTRDFTDVRDVVAAYLLLLKYGENGEIYNICSNYEISIRDIITQLCDLAEVVIDIRQNKSRLRISENRRIFGDNRKIIETTGWQPKISLQQSLIDTLDYWEKKIK